LDELVLFLFTVLVAFELVFALLLLLVTGAEVKSIAAIALLGAAPRGAELVELWKKLLPSVAGGG
jgi:hypothetical protein